MKTHKEGRFRGCSVIIPVLHPLCSDVMYLGISEVVQTGEDLLGFF